MRKQLKITVCGLVVFVLAALVVVSRSYALPVLPLGGISFLPAGPSVELQQIPDAFARLGHSCGGIKQQIFGEGFDARGNVIGYVFAITRCGGSGRGGGYHVTTYSTWVAVTWALNGAVIDEAPSVPSPDPSIAGEYHSGSLVGGSNYPNCNNVTPYDNAYACFSVPVLDSTGLYSVQTSLYVVNQAACSASNTSYCTYRATLTMP